jgi:hypothetical protein
MLRYPDYVQNLIKRKFISKHRDWLKESRVSVNSQSWPLEIRLGIPTELEAQRQPDAVRAWIAAWKSWQGENANSRNANSRNADSGLGVLAWSERRWRSLGIQTVPEKLILESPQTLAAWIGETLNWSRAITRFQIMVQRWQTLTDILPRYYNVLAGYDDTDFFRLTEMLSWLYANPNSGLYPRQIPVAGIDSKWLESRKGLVTELAAVLGAVSTENVRDFHKVCGLRPQPQLIRMRILDPELRKSLGGLGDISAPLEEIAKLDIKPGFIFRVENLQTGLAFEDMTGSVVLMGLGYGVDVLGQIPWLRQARCLYWGDIDTHGFAILSLARKYLPSLKTLLMDEATLLSHRELWVSEKHQHTSTELPLLTGAEKALFQSLKNNVLGQQIRLEQERIRWNLALYAIQAITTKI